MNKKELIESIATKAGISKKDASLALEAMTESVVETVANGDKVQIIGFGTFERRNRAERNGRNPQTGEAMVIPASMAPAFKPGKSFKDTVNA